MPSLAFIQFYFVKFAGNMARITISSILGDISSFFGGNSHNDRFTYQPNFAPRPFSLDASEVYVSITGKEQEIYETTAELRLVIDRLASMFANGLWVHLNKNGEPIEKSPFVSFLENPNAFQSRNEFLFQWYIQRCVYGNVFDYILKGTKVAEVPSAMWHLPPSRTVIKRTGKIFDQTDVSGIITGYELQLDSENTRTFSPDEVIQFSMPNCDDPLLGSSPLLSLRMPISLIRASHGMLNVIYTKKGAIGVWRNDTRDNSGHVPLNPEDKKYSKQMERSFGIGDKQASVIITDKNLRWEPSTYPVGDYKLFESMDMAKIAIVDFYGANKDMFSSGSGGKTGSTFQNREMAERNCYQDTIIPVANDYTNGLSKRFGLLDKGERLILSYDHIPTMKDDEERKSKINLSNAQAIQTMLASGMSPETISEITGIDVGTIKPVQTTQQSQPK